MLRSLPRHGSVVAALLCASAASAVAVVPPPAARARFAADELTALPAAALAPGKALRTLRDLRYGASAAPAAWATFTAAAGGHWEVAWDRATSAPTRIWGSGILAPGAMASPDLAALVARAWLAAHLDLLAPGARASDFVQVSNVYDGNIRAVGFVQQVNGHAVVGGQIGFEFKHDRLFVIGSTALPNVTVPAQVRARLAAGPLRARAIAAVQDQLALPATAIASPLGEDVIVPLVADDAILGYRLAAPITLDAGAAGKYLAYVDVTSGEPIAVRQQNMYDVGTLQYRGVDRYPGRGRVDQPAPLAHVLVDGTAVTTAHDGTLAITGTQTVTTAVAGDKVVVANKATGNALASKALPLATGGSATWDASTVPTDDAQVVSYLAINTVKDFVRANVDAQMITLEDPITANVNIDQSCNAFFDGTAVNFFASSATCQNTGLINDVMFHEFGHSLHTHEIIPGVGAFDGAMSEGAADTLAVNITGDSGLGRGFFYTDVPLRELNPPDHEATWPADIGEIHTTGLIFGGTWWDLRTALHAAYGDTAGEALTLKLYVGALRRSIDIPSSLIEALATDDDDGDLSNGTPNECLIRAAYAQHGMHSTSGAIAGPALLEPVFPASSIQVRVELTGLVDRCHADDIDSVTVAWADGPNGVPTAGRVTATRATEALYYAQMPLPLDGAGGYSATVNYTAGSTFTLPDNRADPRYQVYQGRTVKLYCTDFERDPFAEGWVRHAAAGQSAPWAWAVPGGGATDPQVAFSGTHALMQTPGSDYAPNSSSGVTMPTIDVRPYSDVHLQYRRWLAVEDSHFDQARITANGARVWENATINMGDSSTLQHIDKEWRFQDVALSGLFTGPTLTVGWDLTSDGGLELGGWALDDVCLVANPDSICGDGVLAPFTEQCDNGSANADRPDACRTDCEVPRCGDGIVDTGEECDAGSAGDATCTAKCKAIAQAGVSGGCAAGGSAGGGGLALGLLAVLRRRRR